MRERQAICLGCGVLVRYWRSRVRQYCSKSCAARTKEAARARPLSERLLSQRQIAPNGCWEWQGCVRDNGYGSVSVNGHHQGVHRLAYRHFVGPIPAGLCVLHSCDNRRCINPDHLWIGTKGDNNRDCAEKGRSYGFRTRGGKASWAKLTDAQAETVRQMKRDGWMQKHIAEHFGVAPMIVSNIVTGKTY